jgi:hypothetical protein
MAIKFKGQAIYENTWILILATIGVALFFAFVVVVITSEQGQIQNTNIFNFQNAVFYPNPSIANSICLCYKGISNINVLSNQVPSITNVYLVENISYNSTTDSLSSSSCPLSIKFPGFPSSGVECIYLGVPSSVLPSGNDQYIMVFNSTTYNETALKLENTTESAPIIYAIFMINGGLKYEILEPKIYMQIN